MHTALSFAFSCSLCQQWIYNYPPCLQVWLQNIVTRTSASTHATVKVKHISEHFSQHATYYLHWQWFGSNTAMETKLAWNTIYSTFCEPASDNLEPLIPIRSTVAHNCNLRFLFCNCIKLNGILDCWFFGLFVCIYICVCVCVRMYVCIRTHTCEIHIT